MTLLVDSCREELLVDCDEVLVDSDTLFVIEDKLLMEVAPDDVVPGLLLVEERLADTDSGVLLDEIELENGLAELALLLWYVLPEEAIDEEKLLVAVPDWAVRTLAPAVPRELLEEVPDRLADWSEDVEDCALVDCPLIDCEVKLVD